MAVVEMAQFNLKAGVSEAELVSASKAMQQEFLNQQEGFISRELLHIEADVYVDLIHWSDDEAAKTAIAQAKTFPAANAYFSMMDMERFDAEKNMTHGRVLND